MVEEYWLPKSHAVRHTVATRMLQGGIDLETVRDVLGHAEVTTTARYLHAVDERKRRAGAVPGARRDNPTNRGRWRPAGKLRARLLSDLHRRNGMGGGRS